MQPKHRAPPVLTHHNQTVAFGAGGGYTALIRGYPQNWRNERRGILKQGLNILWPQGAKVHPQDENKSISCCLFPIAYPMPILVYNMTWSLKTNPLIHTA
jgi:hypothetical protein